MILQSLYDLAQREGLVEDPDFEWKPVAWLVRIAEGGRFLGFEGTRTIPPAEGKKKPKPTIKKFRVPREPSRTSGDRAFLLVDKAEYVFGIDPLGKREVEKLVTRRNLFLDRVTECEQAISDAGVSAVRQFLESLRDGKAQVTLPSEAETNDLIAFVFNPDVDLCIHERPLVRAYWEEIRRASPDGETNEIQCLVSGKMAPAAERFDLTKRVPGGSTSGVALVSFNSPAFESFGWKGNANAPISREASEACATALNRLLDPVFPDSRNPGTSLPRRSITISADTAVCYWTSHQESDDFADGFAGLWDYKPEEVKELYHSIWRGKPPHIDDPSAFYALILTGTQGRAIVRDWLESSVGRVADNLAAHYRDLDCVRITPPGKGKELPPQWPLRVFLESLTPPAENRGEEIPDPLATAFIRAALENLPYPLTVLQRAILRYRAELGREYDEKKGWETKRFNDARASLIKAVFNRNRRIHPNLPEVTRNMDPNNKEPGYLLGQLMAVLEQLQQAALDNINASVVDRFFSGASATPKTVFPRLLENARHHYRKALDGKQKGKAILLDRLIDQVLWHFGTNLETPKTLEGAKSLHTNPATHGIPSTLNLDQQGLFILGYHHMRHWLWLNREERMEWEAAHPDAPTAYRWSREKPAETATDEN